MKEKLPSQENKNYWIYLYDSNFAHLNQGGKWMLFYNKNVLDQKWIEIKKLYLDEKLIGIRSLKVSTNKINPRSSDNDEGVIICYCGPAWDKENILQYGKNLIKLMNYKNKFNTCCYKTDIQTENGTKSSGQIKNYLYKINL